MRKGIKMEEKMRILKMVKDGTVTAEQAAELMSAMGVDGGEPGDGALSVRSPYDKKMFRIIVDSTQGDKVNVQLPVGAIKRLIKATGKLPIPDEKMQGIDLNEMMEAVAECLDEEMEGDFVNVNAADGTTVRIFVDK